MKDISFLKKNLIAHRGVHNDLIPENSLDAFKKAIKEKYIIELDVHLTKDKRVVVFHDDNLVRMTGIDKKIKDTTYEYLCNLKLNNTNERIVLLSDVLKLVNGSVPIIIELKYDNRVGLLEKEVVKLLDNYKGEFAVKSFSIFSILWFRIYRNNYVRGLLVSDKKYRRLFSLFKTVTKPDFISCNYKLCNDKRIRKCKFVMAWTIRDNICYDNYKKYFDNLIIDNFKGIK